jgi:hypothetical protein
MRKFSSLILSLIFLLSIFSTAAAQQNTATVTLYNVETSAFPKITGFVDVFDAQKFFASGLKPEVVTVVENGQSLTVDSFTEMALPLQLTVAVNQGTPLDAQDANGISRFQRVAQVIAQWAQSRPADLPDDLSLVSQAGPVINHANAADFIVALNGFTPDFRVATPNLQSLVTALDVVTAQTPRIGMKRAVLFITPEMADPALAQALEPIVQRAIENNVRVFVWYVDANTTFTNTSAAIFNNLAIQTGGTMFQYSGAERFPDLENYFAGLRRIYELSYTSRLNISGEHRMLVQVTTPAFGTVKSVEQTFTLDVQAPNPILVSPVIQITRQAPADDPFNAEILLPETQAMEIIIEFPDGHPRQLVRTTLYVDGMIADENTTEPFDEFTWDLTTYTSSAQHQLMVEAVDVLGLSKTSMAIPVTVTVIKPPSGPSAFLAKYRTPLTFGAIIIAGLALFAVLLSGRFQFLSLRAVQEERRAQNDPLTQPLITLVQEPTAEPVKKKRKAKPKKTDADSKSAIEADASFVKLTVDGQFAAVPPIPIIEKEIIFGTDPVQCTMILDDASISSVHARLRITDDGGYLLIDNNSVGGTWVNYDAIPHEGYRLRHGDMVNFGQLTYRFMLRMPTKNAAPKITPQPTDE